MRNAKFNFKSLESDIAWCKNIKFINKTLILALLVLELT